MSGLLLAAAICRAVRVQATCAIEWRQDKRRRLFFFRAGTLVLVQSNLKSESPERIGERLTGMDGESLCTAVAQLRLREALGEADGEVLMHPDAPAPAFEPLDAIALLWGAADQLAPAPADAAPRAVHVQAALLARIPAGAEVTRYLLELDGGRPLGDVIDFGPDEPDVIARALALAWALGAVEADEGASAVVVRGSSPAAVPPSEVLLAAATPRDPAAPPRVELTVDDIADLIRSELPTDSGRSRITPVASLAAPPDPTPGPSPGPSPQEPVLGAQRPPAPVPPPEPEPADASAHPFGGSSVTVTLGGGRPAGASPADPLVARFGPALTRIRAAETHFAVLGTGWEDAAETHRRAYFGLAQRLHPDRFTADPAEIQQAASELFDRVRGAWEVLGDEDRRAAYISRVIHGEKTDDEKATERVRLILEAESDFKRGVADLQAGRLPMAHELFARVIRAMPDEPEFNAYAGFTTFRLEHTRNEAAAAKGAARVEAALQANEKLDNVWVLRGIILRTMGNEAAARQAFVTALKLRPTNPDAVREMKRLVREGPSAPSPGGAPAGGGFLSRLFGKK
ncbi:MAG: DnaJ domain-containing protein [Pseudomonadota bacterium]|nr:DnaJ domain-containing protein [Pseudomonadota bacterium]